MAVEYSSPPPEAPTTHDHIYTTLLGLPTRVLGLFALPVAAAVVWVRRYPV